MKIIPIIIIIMMAAITSIAAAQSNCFISINDNQLSLLIGPSNASYLLRLINSANSSIYVEAYEFTYWPLANELINASRRGVEVMIVLSGNVYGGVPSSEDAIINELNSSGARVRFMYGYDFTHSKVFIIDNETAVLGSINPTYYGLTRDLGIDVVIHNSTVAHELANIIIEDYEGKPIALDYPGIIVSPINSAQCLGDLLNMPGPLYMAMEELYPSSGEFGAVLTHGHRYVVLNDYGENQAASMELGARLLGGLTAKAIAINGYVYIGSINLDSTSLSGNREIGIIIHNPALARRVALIIAAWYEDASAPRRPNYLLLAAILVIIIALAAWGLMRKRKD